jgi:hypothetical protein
MKRSMLIGFAACALVAMPAFSVSAMPIAPAHSVIDGTDSSVILVKGGHGHGHGWSGLPSWSLEARALLSRPDPGKRPCSPAGPLLTEARPSI